MDDLSPWLALVGLGAFHGLNPGMGWLFALALGLQQQDPRAIGGALPPIGLGHLASLAAIAILLRMGQAFLTAGTLGSLTAMALVVFGITRLARYVRHPRGIGMRVTPAQLFGWSFVMASAHGAGLMAAPFLLALRGVVPAFAIACAAPLGLDHGLRGPAGPAPLDPLVVWVAAIGVHTVVMLGVMAIAAQVVYRRLGLAVLRWGWINFDLIWAVALLVVGGLALVRLV